MTVSLVVISFVLFVSVVVMVIWYISLFGRMSDLKKDKKYLEETNSEFCNKIIRDYKDMTDLFEQRKELAVRVAALESENRMLLERIEAQKEQFNITMEQMRKEFKDMAGEALERNSEMLNRQSQEKLSNILIPFNNDLKQFREKVENYYGEESRQRFSLQENIKSLVEANQRISRDAVNLTNAIAGTNNNKFQGDWGETILEQILENSGLIEGEQWEHQVVLRDEKGSAVLNDDTQRIMKPDVIVHFPGKRDIIIDSKVSLKAYMSYLSAEDDTMRAMALKEHVASVRRHIDELAGKRYDKYNINSLDYVMLFIPNEPSYFMAMEADNALWNYAYKKGIVLISPSNLISTLFVVNSLWTRERQQRDVQKIVDTANSLYDKFVNFTENFRKIESSLDKAHEAYNDAFKQLKTGNGSIAKKLDELKQQGLLTTNKQIHDNFIENK